MQKPKLSNPSPINMYLSQPIPHFQNPTSRTPHSSRRTLVPADKKVIPCLFLSLFFLVDVQQPSVHIFHFPYIPGLFLLRLYKVTIRHDII
jgi:hypothetical protein